jgi:GTP pyrophosphokinase
VMVPLSTPLRTGQTVEIIADKKLGAGPSRDWLNQDLGYLQSPRSRTKVRAWFNATEHEQATHLGRAVVERELQRLGKTAVNLQDLALKMGFEKLDELFFAASKPEFHPRSVETAFEEKTAEDPDALVRARVENLSEARKQTKGSVLVVGTDVLTQLAQCCKPSPPDVIAGFVTRGKGVSIHRSSCSNFKNLLKKDSARVIECSWGNAKDASYAADLRVTAVDRQGLLRDISEVLAKERINVTAVNTQSTKGQARMMFTVQIASGPQLDKALLTIAEVKGVLEARRR